MLSIGIDSTFASEDRSLDDCNSVCVGRVKSRRTSHAATATSETICKSAVVVDDLHEFAVLELWVSCVSGWIRLTMMCNWGDWFARGLLLKTEQTAGVTALTDCRILHD